MPAVLQSAVGGLTCGEVTVADLFEVRLAWEREHAAETVQS